MKGFALVKTPEGVEKVPHDSDEETGRVPQKTKDGADVWNWTHDEAAADALIARREAFRAKQGAKRQGQVTERKAPSKREGKA